ncbi:MAG: hypothetical protein U1D55_18435 [Phycisphaerae bacterium]
MMFLCALLVARVRAIVTAAAIIVLAECLGYSAALRVPRGG